MHGLHLASRFDLMHLNRAPAISSKCFVRAADTHFVQLAWDRAAVRRTPVPPVTRPRFA